MIEHSGEESDHRLRQNLNYLAEDTPEEHYGITDTDSDIEECTEIIKSLTNLNLE